VTARVRHATHVRKRSEFERIQSTGSRVNTERFVLILARQTDAHGVARLGITASRRIGNSVARSRAKRLVREAFRATSELFPPELDLVVIVRRPLGDLKLPAVIDEWRAAASAIRRRSAALLAEPAVAAKAPA
jgi:ribonuclease P protein component